MCQVSLVRTKLHILKIWGFYDHETWTALNSFKRNAWFRTLEENGKYNLKKLIILPEQNLHSNITGYFKIICISVYNLNILIRTS